MADMFFDPKKDRITDKEKIAEVLREKMRTPKGMTIEVFSREHHPGDWTYLGGEVTSCVTDVETDTKRFSFSMDGVNLPSLQLHLIEYVVVYRG